MRRSRWAEGATPAGVAPALRLPGAQVSGGHSGGDIPVPIPNTEVKPASADGTWGEAPWESRTPPEFISGKALADAAVALVAAGVGGGFVASGGGREARVSPRRGGTTAFGAGASPRLLPDPSRVRWLTIVAVTTELRVGFEAVRWR